MIGVGDHQPVFIVENGAGFVKPDPVLIFVDSGLSFAPFKIHNHSLVNYIVVTEPTIHPKFSARSPELEKPKAAVTYVVNPFSKP
jgi:hypothetical protein